MLFDLHVTEICENKTTVNTTVIHATSFVELPIVKQLIIYQSMDISVYFSSVEYKQIFLYYSYMFPQKCTKM